MSISEPTSGKQTKNLALLTAGGHPLMSHDREGWKCYKAHDLIASDRETGEIKVSTGGKKGHLFFLKVKGTL